MEPASSISRFEHNVGATPPLLPAGTACCYFSAAAVWPLLHAAAGEPCLYPFQPTNQSLS